jgi:hypothetical protein
MYERATYKTTGGRAYGALHGDVFNFSKGKGSIPPSRSGFPSLLESEVKPDTPYYLFDAESDWYYGSTDIYVGARRLSLPQSLFLGKVYGAMSSLRQSPPEGLDGFIFVTVGDCLLFWAHWQSFEQSSHNLLSGLKEHLRPLMDNNAVPVSVPRSCATLYQGLEVKEGDSLSLRFRGRVDSIVKQKKREP